LATKKRVVRRAYLLVTQAITWSRRALLGTVESHLVCTISFAQALLFRIRVVVKMKTLLTLAAILLLPGLRLLSAGTDPYRFDPTKFIGHWKGGGAVMVPMTGAMVPFEGEARFQRDSAAAFMRTMLVGRALVLQYSDSGHFRVDPRTDSLQWELWNNLGQYVVYRGVALGNVIVGKQVNGRLTYNVVTEFVNRDSLHLDVTATDREGNTSGLATLKLGRIR